MPSAASLRDTLVTRASTATPGLQSQLQSTVFTLGDGCVRDEGTQALGRQGLPCGAVWTWR